MFKKLVLGLLLLALVVATAGCWDRRELEDRSFVLGLGLDTAAPVDHDLLATGRYSFQVTTQVVLPSMVAGGESAQGPGSGRPTLTASTTADSVYGGIRQFSMRMAEQPFFSYLEVIIIGESLARQGIAPAFDALFRDNEVRRQVPIYVTYGSAREALLIEHQLQPVTAIYLGRLSRNLTTVNRAAANMTLGGLSRKLHLNRPFVIPRLVPAKEEAKLAGAAVIKDGRLVGYLSEEEASGLNWLTNLVKTGLLVDIPLDGVKAVFQVESASTKLIPRLEGNQLSCQVQVHAEGSLLENQLPADEINFEFFDRTEEQIANNIQQLMQGALVKAQQEYQADFLGIDQAIYRRYPVYWRQVAPHWDEQIFPWVQFTFDVDVELRRLGLIH